MDARQYEAVRGLVLDMLEHEAEDDGTLLLKDVVREAQDRFGADPLFPNGRLTNYVRYTKTDMEARCQVERVPGASPQRIMLWRDDA